MDESVNCKSHVNRKAVCGGILPCLNPFWTRWVWVVGFPPICSWGWHQSQHLPFWAAAPPTESDRLETHRNTERRSLLCSNNNAVVQKREKLLIGRRNTTTLRLCLWLQTVVSKVGHKWLNKVRWVPCDSQCTSTRMLTLVFPTALKTRQETGSVKKEWSALVVNTLSLAPCSTTPPFAHLGLKRTKL